VKALWLLAVLALGGCGTLVDSVDGFGADGGFIAPGADGGGGGLLCVADDQCTCTSCVSTADCASGLGLQCVAARRHGQNCADNRTVCVVPGP
jgi:hypothetical protein